jgi:hypothetical protein
MVVDLFDGVTPLRGVFSNVVRFAVSERKDLCNVAASDLGGQRTSDNLLCFLAIMKFTATVIFRDNDLDVAKFTAGARG